MPFSLLILGALGGLVPAIAAPIYLDHLRRELSRSQRIERAARALGLAFSPTDPSDPSSSAFRYPFELFSRGVDQTCENFVTGSVDGVDVVAFDFLYRTASTPMASPMTTSCPSRSATHALSRWSQGVGRMS